MSLEYYDELPIDKVLSRGKHSDGVYLLQNKIIKKVYNPNDSDQMQYFETEIKNLTYLKENGCTFIPQIIAINKLNGTIYMTYCGLSIDMLGAFVYDKYVEEINNKLDILKKYGMILYTKAQSNYHQIINPKHICLLNNCIYFINFGSPLWSINSIKEPKIDNIKSQVIIDNYSP